MADEYNDASYKVGYAAGHAVGHVKGWLLGRKEGRKDNAPLDDTIGEANCGYVSPAEIRDLILKKRRVSDGPVCLGLSPCCFGSCSCGQ